ncbi:MAG TPA: hypothetical protein VIX63_14890 [Vicinamibacterales bacterium]
MRLSRVSLILLGTVLGGVPAFAQPRPVCLHTGLEIPAERQRREEALAAMRLINSAITGQERLPNQRLFYPTWEELGRSPITALPGLGGPTGELARKIRWGTPEPLPGWRIHHVRDEHGYAFTLTDMRDACGFAYHSDETGVIVEGYPVGGPRRSGIVPIT